MKFQHLLRWWPLADVGPPGSAVTGCEITPHPVAVRLPTFHFFADSGNLPREKEEDTNYFSLKRFKEFKKKWKVVSPLNLKIQENRAFFAGVGGNKLIVLSQRLEGMKKWLKTGGFSFEATPRNIDLFREAFPEAEIEGQAPKVSVFDRWSPTASDLRRCAYSPKTDPFPFQWRALAVSADLWPADRTSISVNKQSGTVPNSFAILGEMGTGKTKILIDTAGALWCAGLIDAVLIIAPKGVHTQWIEEQIPEHLGTMVPWLGVALTQRKKNPPDTWPAGKMAVLAVTMDYPSRAKTGKKVCEDFIARFKGRVLIIVDESHNIKTLASQRTEAVMGLGFACAFRRIATGTPISKNLVDAFSQYYFLDREILGMEYITTFKAEYCIMGGFDNDEVVGHKNVEKFWDKLDPFTFRITKAEADLDLPEKFYDRIPFDLSPEQLSHYLAMKNDMITQMDNGTLLEVKNVVSQLMKLQQITCGYLFKAGNKDRGIPDQYEPIPNARVDALKTILESREGKAVIWARFNQDIKTIKELLGKEAVTYWGASTDTERKDAKERFLDPNSIVRYFVANPAAGGSGLNLQGDCSTVIYYSNSFDAIDRWQSEDRVHRIGAKYNITYFDLVARKSIDLNILRNLKAKKSISDLAFDNIRQMLLES